MTLARECIEAMGYGIKTVNRERLLNALRTLAERGPSEGMIAASAADPAMRSVESAIKIAAIHGVELRWPDDGQKLSPSQRSFRAMLAELIREIEEER